MVDAMRLVSLSERAHQNVVAVLKSAVCEPSRIGRIGRILERSEPANATRQVQTSPQGRAGAERA